MLKGTLAYFVFAVFFALCNWKHSASVCHFHSTVGDTTRDNVCPLLSVNLTQTQIKESCQGGRVAFCPGLLFFFFQNLISVTRPALLLQYYVIFLVSSTDLIT